MGYNDNIHFTPFYTHRHTHTHIYILYTQYISVWVWSMWNSIFKLCNHILKQHSSNSNSGFGSGDRARKPIRNPMVPSPSHHPAAASLPSTHEVHSTELFRHPSLPFAHRAAGPGGLEERRGVGAAWPQLSLNGHKRCQNDTTMVMYGDVIYIYMCIYTCVYIYIYIYVHIIVCVYIYITYITFNIFQPTTTGMIYKRLRNSDLSQNGTWAKVKEFTIISHDVVIEYWIWIWLNMGDILFNDQFEHWIVKNHHKTLGVIGVSMILGSSIWRQSPSWNTEVKETASRTQLSTISIAIPYVYRHVHAF